MNKQDIELAINSMNKIWYKQNNVLDKKTTFIYDVENFNGLIDICNRMLSKEDERQYAIHRWVNLQISNFCEECFCKYGAEKVKNNKDKEKDIYIWNQPYDVKVTNYPQTAFEKFNLTTNEGKKDLGMWFYNNQSQEDRKHFKNRLFVVCCGEDPWKTRKDFIKLEKSIKNYMDCFAPTYYYENFNCEAGIIEVK